MKCREAAGNEPSFYEDGKVVSQGEKLVSLETEDACAKQPDHPLIQCMMMLMESETLLQ